MQQNNFPWKAADHQLYAQDWKNWFLVCYKEMAEVRVGEVNAYVKFLTTHNRESRYRTGDIPMQHKCEEQIKPFEDLVQNNGQIDLHKRQ